VNVAPREILDTVERVLYRRGFAPGAARPAAELVLAGLDEGTDALALLWLELPGLDPEQPADVRLQAATEADLDARGACALLMAPAVLDLLHHCEGVAIRGATSESLFAVLAGGARERGWEGDVGADGQAVRVTRGRRCVPSAPRLRASLPIDGAVWSALNRYASDVLAPASAESRADAGY